MIIYKVGGIEICFIMFGELYGLNKNNIIKIWIFFNKLRLILRF